MGTEERMILDKLLQLSDSQAFTVDADGTNSVDLGDVTPKRRVGTGEPLAIVCNVEVAATGGGVYEFQAVQSAAANLSSPDILAAVRPAEADMVKGYIFVIPIPAGLPSKRYIGLSFNNVSGTTGVTVSAHVVPLSHVQMTTPYAKNYPLS